jgi:glycerol-3-phosphate dehydrogenase
MIPEDKTTIIGTTERSENSNVDDIKVNNEDIQYLLQESNKYLKTELKTSDIKETYIGVRPIIKSKKDISQMSREYKLDLHHIANNRILHIYGGKLTTFTSLARKVVNLLSRDVASNITFNRTFFMFLYLFILSFSYYNESE